MVVYLTKKSECYHYICFRLSLFFDVNVSKGAGSVATFVRCGGIFNYGFITSILLSPLVKKIENQSVFGEVMGKSIPVPFFLDTV